MKITNSKIPALKPGDNLTKINKNTVEDILDVQFAFADEGSVVVKVIRNDKPKMIKLKKPVSIQKLKFERSVNKIRKCRNKCIFCFVDQLPFGLRQSLYIKDDDYRLSLLYGNFITLTNLTKKDLDKITAYNISPLYVSIHSINSKTRQLIFGVNERGMENFSYLCERGIKFHVQMVIIPGINDGFDLEKSLKALAGNKQVLSVGIAPAARTKLCPNEFKTFDKNEAKKLIYNVENLKDELCEAPKVSSPAVINKILNRKISKIDDNLEIDCDDRIGKNIYLADEFFLQANEPIPLEYYYDDFPQLENGIGLARLFLDGCKGLASRLEATVLTGKLSFPIIKQALIKCPNIKVKAVKNSFFGKEVTVTGLLGGKDIIRAISGLKGLVLIPDILLNSDRLFLDGLTVESIKNQTNANVKIVPSDAEGFIEEL